MLFRSLALKSIACKLFCLMVWDVETGKQFGTTIKQKSLHAIDLSARADRVATTSSGSSAFVFELSTGQLLHKLEPPQSAFYVSLDYSGRFVFVESLQHLSCLDTQAAGDPTVWWRFSLRGG